MSRDIKKIVGNLVLAGVVIYAICSAIMEAPRYKLREQIIERLDNNPKNRELSQIELKVFSDTTGIPVRDIRSFNFLPRESYQRFLDTYNSEKENP